MRRINEFSNRRRLTLDVVRGTQAAQTLRRLTLNLDQLMQAGHYAKAGGHFCYLSDLSIHEVDFKSIQRWRFWLQDHQKLKNPRYVASVMQHFHGFMSWLRDCGEITTLPRFNYPKRPVHEPKILSMRAQAAILEKIPETGRGVFLTCCLGIRPAEARALDTADCEDGWLTVSKSYAGPTLKGFYPDFADTSKKAR